jgi:hypothetical protein
VAFPTTSRIVGRSRQSRGAPALRTLTPEDGRPRLDASKRAAADAIPATVRSPAAPTSLLSTAMAALCVQAIWMTRAQLLRRV